MVLIFAPCATCLHDYRAGLWSAKGKNKEVSQKVLIKVYIHAGDGILSPHFSSPRIFSAAQAAPTSKATSTARTHWFLYIIKV